MKKRIIRITIFLFLLLVIFRVDAARTYDSKGVNSQLTIYHDAVKEMEDLNCTGELYSQTAVDKCNTLALRKTNALSYMYNAKEYDGDLADDDVNKVLDQNSSSCNTVFSTEIQDAINKVFLLFYIAGPILLILFGSLDLTKAIVAGDEKKRKALYIKFIRRSIALALLFATPAIVNLLVNIFGADKYSKQTYTCEYTEKKVTLKYTPVVSKKGNNKKAASIQGSTQAASDILSAADMINEVSSEKKWTYACTGINTIMSNTEKRKYGQMCCADYVSTVLYYAGLFSKSDIDGMASFNTTNCNDYRGHTYATGVLSFLNKKGWIRIENIEDLQAGDIVFVTPKDYNTCNPVDSGHVEIYAGNNQKYNAGNTQAMQTRGTVHATYKQSSFVCAYRAPNAGKGSKVRTSKYNDSHGIRNSNSKKK